MKISEYIEELQEILDKEGDLEVYDYEDDEWFKPAPYVGRRDELASVFSDFLPEKFVYVA